jgi:molybdopterin synthase catalytic subunit
MVRSVKISVRLFAGLRERAGADRVELELPDDARAGDVLAAMGLEPGQCIVALDREYARADERVRPDHEVALIPPVSGGADVVRLVDVTAAPLDIAAVAAAVRDPRAGAVVTFEGVTREVEALDYGPTWRWRARSWPRSVPKRPSATGCGPSRSCTASAACRSPSRP